MYLFSLNKSEFNTNIFNRKLYLIENEMMEDTLFKGDIAIITTKEEEYNIGDIILFKDQSGIKIERIMEIIVSNIDKDEKVYITKADKGFYLNNFLIKENMIIGKYIRKISNMSWFLNILRSKITTIVIIIILSIILFFLIQIRIYEPSRSKDINENETFINQIKEILTKDKKKNRYIKGRHSREAQKKK